MSPMYFESIEAAWQMAGHGPYVWACYAVFLIVLVALIWAPMARQRRFLRGLRGAERRRDNARATASKPQQ